VKGIAQATLVAALSGCGPRAVSPPEARVATPASVTLANPVGDAREPEDAALTRLLEAPASERTDRWRTVGIALPDPANWRRIRVFGHPTRVAYRYGDDHLALDALEYRPADGADSPKACLQRFEDRALEVATRFGITFEAIVPGNGQHPRGVEALDSNAASPRRALVEAASAVTGHAGDVPSGGSSSGPTDVTSTVALAPPPALRLSNDTAPRAPSLTPRAFFGRPGGLLGFAPMPNVRSAAEVVTFFRRQRYVGAVAAFQSWPGTCLVRAFAARVGTDEALGQRVVDRWVAELAPRTRWSVRLRRAPRFEDR